jgi:hypothetical protein
MKDFRVLDGVSEEDELQRIIGSLNSYVYQGKHTNIKVALEGFIQKNGTKFNKKVFEKNMNSIIKSVKKRIERNRLRIEGKELGHRVHKRAKKISTSGFTIRQDLSLEEWKAKHPTPQ